MAALSRRALFGFALLLLPLAGALPAWADALDDALKAGLVGETREGYIAPIQNPPAPEITALVNNINARRRAQYTKIAEENGSDIQTIERIAGKRVIERARPGTYVKNAAGDWIQK
ncbi:MAG: YdbL family protein [Rhodospirillaceae bacterium]|nr:YdbL family protein [Rhodospirillaceae bacterium]MBT6117961.1 YdbL family protein [Rhodospirillaceae bacterium]